MAQQVKVRGLAMSETLRNVVERHVCAVVGANADQVGHLDVRFVDLGDVGNDRGVVCRIRAEVDGLGAIDASEAHMSAFQAVAAAAENFADRVAEGLAGRRVLRTGVLEGVSG